MDDYFWLRETQPIPDGIGFGLFSATHVAALGVVLLGVVVLPTLGYVRLGDVGRRRMRLTIGCLLLGMDIVVQTTYVITGDYTPQMIPLELCSLGVYVVFIDGLKPNLLTREIMYSLSIWGALAALVFPDWANRPLWNIFSLQQFFGHGLLVLYPVMLMVAREFRPDWRRLGRVLLVLAPFTLLCYVLNKVLGTNLMFLAAGAPGSPLEPIQAFAGALYIPLLARLLLLVWVVEYTPWVLASRFSRNPVAVG
ncbi:MAG: TIGR02206 family membrane protein [Propionibacteriaceae bacterium]|jgi:hypothetical integral membrane protein (TIGR02206 family)|nr:TIGR02206 family membrane protein [Propionibacteriaceae bacterium]